MQRIEHRQFAMLQRHDHQHGADAVKRQSANQGNVRDQVGEQEASSRHAARDGWSRISSTSAQSRPADVNIDDKQHGAALLFWGGRSQSYQNTFTRRSVAEASPPARSSRSDDWRRCPRRCRRGNTRKTEDGPEMRIGLEFLALRRTPAAGPLDRAERVATAGATAAAATSPRFMRLPEPVGNSTCRSSPK